MKAKDLMTPQPFCCSPDDSVQDVARVMRDNDCGSVPIVESGRVVGIVTDRDLALRALAVGRTADTRVRDIMTASPGCCGENDDVRSVEKLMADRQVRRVPIVNADGTCVGIISQADLALAAADGESVSEREVVATVSRISEPSQAGSGDEATSRARV